MKKSTIHGIRNLVPTILAAAAVAPATPPAAAPTAPARPAVIRLAVARPASATALEPPEYAGQWMDANDIPHTPMYVPEPRPGAEQRGAK